MDVRRLSIWVVVGRTYSISKFSPVPRCGQTNINIFGVEKRIFGIISKVKDRGIVYYLCICIMLWSWGNKVLDSDSSSNAGRNEASYIIAGGALDGIGKQITFARSAIDMSITSIVSKLILCPLWSSQPPNDEIWGLDRRHFS